MCRIPSRWRGGRSGSRSLIASEPVMSCYPPIRPPPARMRRAGRRLGWAPWLLLIFGLCVAPLRAEDKPALEVQVKAVFLAKFAMFVEWPATATNDTQGTILIGILGKDPFGDFLDAAAKRESINGRRIELRRSDDVEKLAGCQIVFISASESARLSAHLAGLAGKPVLTVGDESNFAGRGVMIGFIKEAGMVRFEINTRAAELAGLKLSAKLLQVGKIVTVESPSSRLK
ncbi:MAG: YfiR family protein [Verrucomicrobiota bacterium]